MNTTSPSTSSSAPPQAVHPDHQAYMDSLSVKERKAFEIARSHLGMSFDLEKSRGYLAWQSKRRDVASS